MAIPTNQKIFGLLGQSNMSGYAPLPQVVQTYSNVYVFGNDYIWKNAKEPVDDKTNQVDSVSLDDRAAYGLSAKFGNTMYSLLGSTQPIGLVPCAKGGSHLINWGRPSNPTDRGTLYGSALYRLNLSQSNGVITGLIFFQGEGDARTEIEAHDWDLNFKNLVNNLRTDLGKPNLPIVYAQIGKLGYEPFSPYFSLVQSKQENLFIENTKFIVSSDMTLYDNAHYTAESYDILADRFANAMFSLLK